MPRDLDHRSAPQSAELEAVLARIEGIFGREISPDEAELRAELTKRMDKIKASSPDPLGETPAERLAVDPDWRAHTAEGKTLNRRRSQWLGKMRRHRLSIRAELERARAEAVLADHVARHVVHPTRCSARRPRAARSRRCSSRGSPDRESEPDDLVHRTRTGVSA